MIISGNIVTPEGVLEQGALTVDNGTITELRFRPRGKVDHDFTGYLIVPGFIDLHIHGGGGADFMDGTPEAARQVARTHARFGTTGLLATTLTATRAQIDQTLQAIGEVIEDTRGDEAALLGTHLEGPYINANKRGAQPLAPIRDPDIGELRDWIKLSNAQIRQITMAPELPGAAEFIPYAARQGINVSIGHTTCNKAQALRAIEWGASQATHLFNAMPGLHHREPGPVGVLLDAENSYVELICDGVHLDQAVAALAVRARGFGQVLLITDAMAGAAMPNGTYQLGGQDVDVVDGTATFEDGTLAGSVLTMNLAFHNVREFTGASRVQAAAMTSLNAARRLNLDRNKGSVEVDKDADLAVLDPETGRVEATIRGGQFIYRR